MEELNEFQKWCKDLVTVAQACAEGKEVERQDIDGKWHKKHTTCGFEFGYKYRIKPRTIVHAKAMLGIDQSGSEE